MDKEIQKKVIAVIVLNEHSVLARVSGLFAGRGYNIESLTVAPIPNTEYSRMTITTSGNKRTIEQIKKQVLKLIPTLKVIEKESLIEKEMVLLKFPISSNLSDIDVLCRTYNGHIVNVADKEIIAMVCDDTDRIERFIHIIDNYSPTEIVRGGVVAIER